MLFINKTESGYYNAYIEYNTLPSQICLKANAAAAAESSDIFMPLTRILMTVGKKESPLGAALSL